MTEKRLSGKSIVITGGSRGIGKTIAETFLKSGANVVISSRSSDELEDTANELSHFGEIHDIRADVSSQQDVIALRDYTLKLYEKIDVLVNAAAIQGPIGPLTEVDIDHWISCVHIDLVGTALCCKAVLPIMQRQNSGKIINFSGGGATSARPNFTAYASSKAAVVKFTEALASEVAQYNIDVNAIAPGVVKTRMLQEVVAAGERAGKQELSQVEKAIQNGGTPPQLAANLALFLASDESNGITGRLISALWDDWRTPDFRDRLLQDLSLYTLRRIDGRNFTGVAH